jgi:hypothetical protein
MPQEFRPEPLLIEQLEKLLEPTLACAGSGARLRTGGRRKT